MGASAFFLAMRRLRAPILVLVGVFAVGITGLALIPGVDEEGRVTETAVEHVVDPARGRTAEEAARSQPQNLPARLTFTRSLLAAKDLVRAEREIAALRKEFAVTWPFAVETTALPSVSRTETS